MSRFVRNKGYSFLAYKRGAVEFRTIVCSGKVWMHAAMSCVKGNTEMWELENYHNLHGFDRKPIIAVIQLVYTGEYSRYIWRAPIILDMPAQIGTDGHRQEQMITERYRWTWKDPDEQRRYQMQDTQDSCALRATESMWRTKVQTQTALNLKLENSSQS